MIGPSASPTFFDLLKSLWPVANKTQSLYPVNKKSPPLFLTRSSWSFWLIIKYHQIISSKKNLKIAVPNYICHDFLKYTEDLNISLIYYPIKADLTPDWEWLQKNVEELDIFVLVHYFGHISDIETGKKFCHKKKCLFVEDGSHLLQPVREVGVHSDFTFYSPYKLLPIPDGSVLTYKIKKKENKEVLNNLYNEKFLKRKPISKWVIKKVIQIFIPEFIYNKLLYKPLPFNQDPSVSDMTSPYLMSNYSKKYICSLDTESIAKIVQERRDNYYILKNGIGLKPLLPLHQDECPYFFAHKPKEVLKGYQELTQNHYFPSSWPDLPKSQVCSQAQVLRNSVITIPIHQKMSKCRLLKKIKTKSKIQAHNYSVSWLEESLHERNQDEQTYRDLFQSFGKSNLLQSWEYGESKKSPSNQIKRGLLYYKDQPIGVVQGIVKTFLFGVKVLRVNRGPLFHIIDSSSYLNIIRAIKKNHLVTFIAPEFTTPSFHYFMKSKGSIKWKKNAHQSIWVDLTKTQETLRSELNSKWRNTLKAAEKNELSVKIQDNEIEQLISDYSTQQETLGFQGISREIILSLHHSGALLQFHAQKDGQRISTVVLAKHAKACTYLIGWNSESGKALKANYLLLWIAINHMKKEGFTAFDLGGIDEEETPQITKFKRGISSDEYKLIGEYISI